MAFLNFRRACGALVLALSVSVAACGGDDDEDNDNTNNSNTVEGRCESVADKIYGCDVSCADDLITQAEFVDNCIASDPALSEADRDQIVDASCDELDEFLCSEGGGGGCPGTQVCAAVQGGGVCVDSVSGGEATIPADAAECSTATGGQGCPSGYGCLTSGSSTDGYCLLLCDP